MKTQSVIALKFLIVMTLLTGLIYPLIMTGIAQVIFPSKSNGSLILNDGKVIGSELIGQQFDNPIYFWSRPSSISYNPIPSGASNFGPTSDTLRKIVESRRQLFGQVNSITNLSSIPKEMIFASGSGLDPHISPEAAYIQVDRIAKARHFTEDQREILLKKLKTLTKQPQFLFLGEKRINVLILNKELDNI